jgi:hypothetical protein
MIFQKGKGRYLKKNCEKKMQSLKLYANNICYDFFYYILTVTIYNTIIIRS